MRHVKLHVRRDHMTWHEKQGRIFRDVFDGVDYEIVNEEDKVEKSRPESTQSRDIDVTGECSESVRT